MPNNQKLESVQNLKDKVSRAKSIIFAEYKGISANDMNALRAQASENDAEVTVAKNTLMKIALSEEKLDAEAVDTHLKGSTATVFGYGDPISPIKMLVEFAKKLGLELPKIKAGFVDGRFASAADVDTLSKLPPREQLIAQVVGGIKSPLSGLVNVLGGSQKKLVYALSAIADKKEAK